MEQPKEFHHISKPFVTLLDDSIWLARECEALSNEPNPKGYCLITENIGRLARQSVLSAALATEALGNVLINTCEYPNKLSDDVDKLTALGKFDVYLIKRGCPHFLDRGHKLVQPISELMTWRNSCAHPKVTKRKWKHKRGCEYEADTPLHSALQIPYSITDRGWNEQHARRVISAVFAFTTHYLLGWCEHRPLEMRELLFDEAHHDDGKVQHYHYQYSKHMSEAVRDWKLDDRFLCQYVGRTECRDGYQIRYEPGYPEDIEVSRTRMT